MFWRRTTAKTKVASGDDASSIALDERIYAIGDVHGRIDLLKSLLSKIYEDVQTFRNDRTPRLIFLGDYVDRGDQSREVIDYLIDLNERGGQDVVFLAGNHEAALLSFIDNPYQGREWLNWGGRQTLASYNISPPSQNLEQVDLVAVRDALVRSMGDHIAFLRSLERYTTSGSFVFAHASLDSAFSLENQPESALFWGTVSNGKASGLPGWKLVHGHFDAPEPISNFGRICVDTGAYYSGILTAVRLDEGEAFLKASVYDI